jgi:hypothetical protein
MTQPSHAFLLDSKLEPLCPRDKKVMRYKANGLPSGTDNRPASCCGHEGCNVRYDLVNGYFTLIGMPERINPVGELCVNTLVCERHGTWVYRRRDQAKERGNKWCCGVEGDDFCILAGTKGSWVRT